MADAWIVLVAVLALPGVLPAVTWAGRQPAALFLAPLVGSVMAAVAVEFELAVGGSLVTWYTVVALAANAASLAAWAALRRRGGARSTRALGPRQAPSVPSGLPSLATLLLLAGAMALPVSALRVPMIGYDTNAIWLTHTLLVSGGHNVLHAGLQNPAYRSSNPDYPPLVPGAGALVLVWSGPSQLHDVVVLVGLLNACALGALGAGVAAAVGTGSRPWPRALATVAGAAVSAAGFAVGGQYAANGYADLLWSAAAAAAVVWGLVLPRSLRALAVAWACAVVAMLTKNEGLVAGILIAGLVATRYALRPGTWSAGRLARAGAMVALPAIPGVAWAAIIRGMGIHDSFFGTNSAEPPAARLVPTVSAVGHHLAVLPAALAVAVVGTMTLHARRRRLGLAGVGWLWLAAALVSGAIVATYVFGADEIHWWLQTSVDRTTMFSQIALLADMAVWTVVAGAGAGERRRRRLGLT